MPNRKYPFPVETVDATGCGDAFIAGLLEAAGNGVFHNTYVVAMPDGRLVRHRKLHAFEHPAIQPGDEHTVFDTPHGFRAAILVCYDNNIVENVRIAALRGAEVLLAPHQTGGCRTTNPHLMGVIDRRLWDERHANPGAIEPAKVRIAASIALELAAQSPQQLWNSLRRRTTNRESSGWSRLILTRAAA